MRGQRMPRTVLSTKTGTMAIEGELLKEVTSGAWPRWIEIGVYKLDDGGYAVHRVGKSKVYHREDTPCSTVKGLPSGKLVTVDNLPDDAEPCRVCNPVSPQDMDDDEQIRMEVDRPVLAIFNGAQKAQDFIVTVRDRYTQRPGVFVSNPVAELIQALRGIDPDWAALDWPEPTTANPEGTVRQKNQAG